MDADLNSFKRTNLKYRYVYGFIDDIHKVAYIGLTNDLKKRKRQHLSNRGLHHKELRRLDKKGSLKFKVLSNKVTSTQAQEKEIFFVNKYSNLGYNLLNIAKAGVLGGGVTLWTKKNCRKSALKYKTRKEWNLAEIGAYKAACNKGWLNYCCSHMTILRVKRTKKNCKKSALTYNTRKEWAKHASADYQTAQKNGWLEYCCSHMISILGTRVKWTKEACRKSALKYKTRTEWNNFSETSYRVACKNGWLEYCCSHMIEILKPSGYWTKEACRKSALKYKTRSSWKLKESGAYSSAFKNGWIDHCCSHMTVLLVKRTKENCKESALKYKTRKEWNISDQSAYCAAWKNGWLDYCCSHMRR